MKMAGDSVPAVRRNALKNSRHGLAAGGALCLALLSPTPGHAQGALATTGAVNLLAKVTGQMAAAGTVEYTSVLRTVDAAGQPVTLYVHAKIRRPGEARLTISPKSLDAPDGTVLVANGEGVTAYDAGQQRTGHQPLSAAGLALPFGFAGLEPALKTVRQVFATAPFAALFPGDERDPLTITRQNLDMLNVTLITSRFSSGMRGQQKLAKMWVDRTASTPRRLVTGDVMNDTERVGFVEDFMTFVLNPSLPDDTFRWTPPASQQTNQTPTPAPPAPIQQVPTRPAPPKRTRKALTVKKGHGAKTRSTLAAQNDGE